MEKGKAPLKGFPPKFLEDQRSPPFSGDFPLARPRGSPPPGGGSFSWLAALDGRANGFPREEIKSGRALPGETGALIFSNDHVQKLAGFRGPT